MKTDCRGWPRVLRWRVSFSRSRPFNLKNWVALVNWIHDQHVDAAQLAYANIDQNDVCYIYLKTGKWMRSLPAAQADGGPGQTGLLLVTKLSGEEKRRAHGDDMFVSGPVHVISLPRP